MVVAFLCPRIADARHELEGGLRRFAETFLDQDAARAVEIRIVAETGQPLRCGGGIDAREAAGDALGGFGLGVLRQRLDPGLGAVEVLPRPAVGHGFGNIAAGFDVGHRRIPLPGLGGVEVGQVARHLAGGPVAEAFVADSGDPGGRVVEAVLHDVGPHRVQRLVAGPAFELGDVIAGEFRLGRSHAAGRPEQPVVHLAFVLGGGGPGESSLRIVGGPGGHGGLAFPVLAALFLDEGKGAQRVALGPGLEDQRALGAAELGPGAVAELLVNAGELLGRQPVEESEQPLGAVEPAGRLHDRAQVLVDRLAAVAGTGLALALHPLREAEARLRPSVTGLGGGTAGIRRGGRAGVAATGC